jgi:hypothetical protein
MELDQEFLFRRSGEFLGDDVGGARCLARSASGRGAGTVIDGATSRTCAARAGFRTTR